MVSATDTLLGCVGFSGAATDDIRAVISSLSYPVAWSSTELQMQPVTSWWGSTLDKLAHLQAASTIWGGGKGGQRMRGLIPLLLPVRAAASPYRGGKQ